MTKKVVSIPDIGEVTFSQNKLAKSIKLSIRANNRVLVSFPYFVSPKTAYEFVIKNRDWIETQKKKIETKISPHKLQFPLKTRFHTVSLLPGSLSFKVQQKKSDISIFYPAQISPDDERIQNYAHRVLVEIYRMEAKVYLPQRLKELSAKHNLPCGKVTIRNNRSNWGSCSSQNNISLNLSLMKLPDHLIDFIILHELAHTRVKNHSRQFWELLDNISDGKAKQLTAEMRKYAPLQLTPLHRS